MTEAFAERECIVVLENPNYIINIGHVIRNAVALGADRLFVIDGRKRLDDDPERIRKRKSLLKHSSGTVASLSVSRFDDTTSCLALLAENRFTSVATSPHGRDKAHFSLETSRLDTARIAIWFGEESHGLSPEAFQSCSFSVEIPMAGAAESLNLASSTAILLYEAAVQRRRSRE